MPDSWLGRYSRYVEKLFNVKGGPSIFDVSPSIQGVIQMSTPPFEERYLVGVESFAASFNQAAVPGNKSAVMIRNPLGSGVIGTLEKILVLGGTGGVAPVQAQFNLMVAGSNPADLANPISSFTRADPRSRSHATCIVTSDAPAVDPGTGFLIIGLDVAARSEFITLESHEIVLLPQIALRVVCQLVNTPMTFTLFWRERQLESSELT